MMGKFVYVTDVESRLSYHNIRLSYDRLNGERQYQLITVRDDDDRLILNKVLNSIEPYLNSEYECKTDKVECIRIYHSNTSDYLISVPYSLDINGCKRYHKITLESVQTTTQTKNIVNYENEPTVNLKSQFNDLLYNLIKGDVETFHVYAKFWHDYFTWTSKELNQDRSLIDVCFVNFLRYSKFFIGHERLKQIDVDTDTPCINVTLSSRDETYSLCMMMSSNTTIEFEMIDNEESSVWSSGTLSTSNLLSKSHKIDRLLSML